MKASASTSFRLSGDSEEFIPGFGVAVGPYFRLGLWGANKQGGLGLAPYFTLNLLRLGKVDTVGIFKFNTEVVAGIGGGARVDIFSIAFLG